MILDKDMDHEYSAIDGITSFREKCLVLSYGEDSQARKDGRIAAC